MDLIVFRDFIVSINNDNRGQIGKLFSNSSHLTDMFFCRENRFCLCIIEPCEKRLFTKCRKQWLGNSPHFQNTDEGNIEFRDPVHKNADTVTRIESHILEIFGKRITIDTDVVIREFLTLSVETFPNECEFVTEPFLTDAVSAVISDIIHSFFSILKYCFRVLPRES